MKKFLIPILIIFIFLVGLLIASVSAGIPESFWKSQNKEEGIIKILESVEKETFSTRQEEGMIEVSPQIKDALGKDGELNEPFIFVSILGPQTGGFPAESEAFYVNRTDRAQVSKETSNGRLYRLSHGYIDHTPFFDALAYVVPLDDTAPQRERDLGELTDYYPPRIAVAYDTESKPYYITSFQQEDVPEWLRILVVRMMTLRDQPELSEAEPGIYARAQRLPEFDHQIQKPDVVIDAMRAAIDERLLELLRHEMALVRMGNLDETIMIAEQLTLSVGRSIHIQVGETVYRIVPFRYQGNEN